ncbi:hypothetical protein K2X85_18360 [bacterium]|nr:hypothetical protein [bacterium]
MSWRMQLRTWGITLALLPVATLGVVMGIALVQSFRTVRTEYRQTEVPADHRKKIDAILATHLDWAANEDVLELKERFSPVSDFFEEARNGTRGFAEEALGWESKWKVITDYTNGENQHPQLIQELFEKWIFSTDQLEKLLQSTVAIYLEHLDDVDSQLLTRLEADLAGLPYDVLPLVPDLESLHRRLEQAMAEAVETVQADFQGMVHREVVSFVVSEVLAVAAVKMATSAGLLGTGAVSGTATFGVGLLAGIITDYCVSWVYDQMYDPIGEISRRLDATLLELETIILFGDSETAGLEQRLRFFSERRCQARDTSIRAALIP